MTDPKQSTWEEASRCPKCGEPGELGKTIPTPSELPRGTKLYEVYCRNGDKVFSQDCKWFNTPWLVQVNPDGSVPAPSDHKGEPKQYVGDFGSDEEAQRVINQLKWEEEQQRNPGTEIRSPWA